MVLTKQEILQLNPKEGYLIYLLKDFEILYQQNLILDLYS